MNKAKIAAVAEYLAKHVLASACESHDDKMRHGQVFRVRTAGRADHRLLVSGEFLEDHDVTEISRCLMDWQVAAKLIAVGANQILVVTNEGVRVE